MVVLQTSDGIVVGVFWSFTPSDSPGQSLGQQGTGGGQAIEM